MLNPRETRIYLFLIIDRNNILKVKTDETILPKYWDFKSKKVKQSYVGCSEFNTRLDNLKTNVLNVFRKLVNDYPKADFSIIAENIKSFVLDNHIPIKDTNKKSFYEVFLV